MELQKGQRRVNEGTSAVLLQSGLGNEWWADLMECYCYLRNIQDLLSDGKTPYERPFGMPFNGPVIPFGAMVEYQPYFCEGHIASTSIWSKSLARKISRLCMKRGDVMVADIEEWEEIDASEIHARRLNAKEVWTPMKGDNFRFPVADGTVKNPWRRSTSETIHLNPRSPRPRRRTRQSSRRIRTDHLQLYIENHRGLMVMPEMISGPLQAICHHVEPRVKLNVPREESFLVPLKYIDVTRTTNTPLDVMLESNIDDCWNVDGERELSDTWTGFTRGTVLNENHRMDIYGPGRDWQENKRPPGQTLRGQSFGKICLMRRNAKAKVGFEKPKLDNAWQLRGIYFIDIDDGVFFRISWRMRVERWKFRCQPQCFANFNLRLQGNLSRWKMLQDKIRLYCWSWRIYENPNERSSSRISWISHCRKRNEFIESLQYCAQINSSASSNENTRCKSRSGEIMGKTREHTGMTADESQIQEWGDRWSKEWRQNRTLCIVNGSLSSPEFGVGAAVSKIQRSSRTPRWHCEWWFRIICRTHGTGIISITNDGCKKKWIFIKATRMRRTSSRRNICLHPDQKWKMHHSLLKKNEFRMSGYLDTSTKQQMA